MTDAENKAKAAAEAVPVFRKASLSKLKTFSSLANPVYRLYFAQSVCQLAAQNMQQITRSLLIYRITGSAAAIGIMTAAGAVPHVVATLFGGVIADRMQKNTFYWLPCWPSSSSPSVSPFS